LGGGIGWRRRLSSTRIKPANLFVTRLGTEYDYVKILDFGVVKDQSGRDATVLSNQDMVHGTPAFMPPEIVMRHRPTHFAHVFSGGGYASAYYSYMWSEVLDADAFAAFQETGDIFDPATAKKLHDHVYSAGGKSDPEALYTAFRGRLPTAGGAARRPGEERDGHASDEEPGSEDRRGGREHRRRRDDGPVETLALVRLDLLGVVQAGERADAVAAERPVVEQDARDDERAGERAASRLVRAGDEPRTEAPVVPKKPLTRRERHRVRG